jgi:AmmeMemoRadiSam system protein B
MLRLPAVAGQFYPGNPKELISVVKKYATPNEPRQQVKVRACLVPHAGYMYSGCVAGAVFARISLPKKILILGVRHFPGGEDLAILSEGAWRTPLGDAPIDSALANQFRAACPTLQEDRVAHSREHSLEVQLPFLQVLDPQFSFVPIAVGSLEYEELVEAGQAIANVLANSSDEILIVTSSDMNHYEDDDTTRAKDRQAIDCLLHFDPRALYVTCRAQNITMCGLGPAIVMLTAMNALGVQHAELVRYGTSGDISGNRDAVVGYAGLTFA